MNHKEFNKHLRQLNKYYKEKVGSLGSKPKKSQADMDIQAMAHHTFNKVIKQKMGKLKGDEHFG